MSVTLTLYVAGLLVPGSAADTVSPEGLYAGDTLDITWGRGDTLSQPDPSTATFRLIRPAPVSWLRIGADVSVFAQSAGHPTVCVFLGSITSLTMQWDPDLGPVVDVIADDVLADLGNRRVASKPWPRESLGERVDHIMDAARQDVPVAVGSTVSGTQVAKQDVDTLMAADALQALAASVDGILWSTVAGSNRPALRLEDPGTRPALRRLAKPAALIVIVFDSDAVAAVAITLDPCVFDRDPVQFVQDVDDIVTGVSVTYYTPDTDPTAPDVGVTVDVVDRAAENPNGGWGVRRVDLDTQLTNATDAQAVGDRIVGRLRPAGVWHAPGLSFDDATTAAITDGQLLALLDLAHRNGQALVIPLPGWAPNGPDPLIGYLEGGLATYSSGWWSLELTVAVAHAYGGADVRWIDLPDDPAWCWNNWDPNISWDDLAGVGPPVGVT